MTRILYLAGAGRSGSTLLGMILGQLPQFFNVGEIKWFWSDAAEGSRLCGCGQAINCCPFWSDVISDLEEQGLSISRIATALVPRLTRSSHLPWIAAGQIGGRNSTEWKEFGDATARLYDAVARKCPGKIIVDGSKLPPHLILLGGLPNLDLRLLHLVRDGRGVAYSWQKRWEVAKGRKRSKDFRVGHRSSYKALLIWIFQNYLIEKLAERRCHRAMIRYEDFVDRPRSSLEKALGELGLHSPLPLLDGDEIVLHPTHALGGSHEVRFGESRRRLVLDDQWRLAMHPMALLVLSIMGLHSLRRYGYRVFPSRGSAGTQS